MIFCFRDSHSNFFIRWYRSPEIILLEKIYSTSVDIWAAGCVFAELLQLIPANAPDYKTRRAIFTGMSCFPLSPSLNPTQAIAGLPVSPRDQLNTILSLRGTPPAKEAKFLNDKKAEEYLNAYPIMPKRHLGTLFQVANPLALDLLDKLLTFNPYYRITAKEALRHKYFEDIRDKTIELEFVSPIFLNTDKYSDDIIISKVGEVLTQIKIQLSF